MGVIIQEKVCSAKEISGRLLFQLCWQYVIDYVNIYIRHSLYITQFVIKNNALR
jgi:hypothetical protein